MSEIYGHRTHGGTGLTNFDKEERPLFEAAIEQCGDPDFFISDAPMAGTSANSITENYHSLHYKGGKRDLSYFWSIYRRLKAEAA